MRLRARDLFTAASALIAIAGCTSPIEPPETSKAETEETVSEVGSQMIGDLVGIRGRLVDIEYRLTRAAAPLCGEWNRPHPGVLVAEHGSFEERRIQDIASEALSIADAVTVVYVVAKGPFDRAGLRPGDTLLSIAGERLTGTNDLMPRLLELHEASMVGVEFRRDDGLVRTAHVDLDLACPVRFGHSTSALIVPWQMERVILSIPLGLLKHPGHDAVLAVAMGHQLAHALFDKPDDDSLTAETRADSIGLRITARAGFDVGAAVSYWEDVAAEYPSLIGPAGPGWRPLAWSQQSTASYEQLPHADIARRLTLIREEVERLEGAP